MSGQRAQQRNTGGVRQQTKRYLSAIEPLEGGYLHPGDSTDLQYGFRLLGFVGAYSYSICLWHIRLAPPVAGALRTVFTCRASPRTAMGAFHQKPSGAAWMHAVIAQE